MRGERGGWVRDVQKQQSDNLISFSSWLVGLVLLFCGLH